MNVQLTKDTRNLLTNLMTINNTQLFSEGSVLHSRSPGQQTYAEATVSENFPRRFFILDLKHFAAVLDGFKEPTLHFENPAFVIITEPPGDGLCVTYHLGDESLAYAPDPKHPVILTSTEVEFTLSAKNLTLLKRLAGTLGTPDLVVESDGNDIRLMALNKTNPLSNVSTLPIGAAQNKKAFRLAWKIDHLKLIEGDYSVAISSSGLSRFQHQHQKVTYHILLDSDSQYDGTPVGKSK